MLDETQETGGIKYWFKELEEAKKRDKGFLREGQRIIDIYECKDNDKVPFNILYSNTDTLIPALYSAVPRPVCQRRFKDDDPIGLAVCKASDRMLSYLIDTDLDGYETFNEGILCAVIDSLLPGRGVTRIKYDAEVGEYLEQDSEMEDSDEEPIDGDQAEDAAEPGLQKESELVCVDSIKWDKVLFGYATKWSRVPWIAFEEIIDKDEAIRLFGKETANKIKFTLSDEEQAADEDQEHKDEHQGGRKTATIYQIWDKDGGRKVRYVSKHFKDDYLKVEDDPLHLSGFYPMPKPIVLLAKSNNLEVTAPYLVYENQSKEINELTRRINRLVKAIKAKGVYDAELGSDIENLMGGDDNTLIPADKSAALASDKGFANAIWFMPIEEMVNVLRELYVARDACKQVIYEVTGISDIIRGATNANETATAQGIKSQWGTMRLKRNQGEVQRYCRDMLRIMLEVAATKFSEETWVKATMLPYATEQQVAQAQQVMAAAQQMQAQLPPPQIGPDGQPQPPQIPPQLQQILDQAQQTLSQPKWAEVLGVLKDDMQRTYRVDIETNSTVVPEAVEDQKNIAEVMTALGSYLQGVTPLIQEGAFPFEAAKAMMLAVVRRYQFGDEIEQYINEMHAPPPPPPPAPDNSLQVKQMEIQADGQKTQAQTQARVQEHQAQIMMDARKAQSQNALDEKRLEVDQQNKQIEIQAARELEIMRLDTQERIAMFQANLQSQTQLEIARIQAESTIHQLSVETFNQDQKQAEENDRQDQQHEMDLLEMHLNNQQHNQDLNNANISV
jgi:hypothetical protein